MQLHGHWVLEMEDVFHGPSLFLILYLIILIDIADFSIVYR